MFRAYRNFLISSWAKRRDHTICIERQPSEIFFRFLSGLKAEVRGQVGMQDRRGFFGSGVCGDIRGESDERINS